MHHHRADDQPQGGLFPQRRRQHKCPRRRQRQAADGERLPAESVRQPPAQRAQHYHAQGGGYHHQPHLFRRVAQHPLQVEGHHKARRRGAEKGQPRRRNAQPENGVGEQAQFQHGRRRPQFPADECGGEDDYDDRADDDRRRLPAQSVAVAHHQQQRQQDDAGHCRAQPVKGGVLPPAVLAGGGAPFQQRPGYQQRQASRRHIDEKDRLPAQPCHQKAAQGRAGDGAQSHHAEVRPQGFAPFRIGEGGNHHTHAAALHHPGADALQHPHHDEQPQTAGQPGPQRADDENRRADEIDAAPPDDIAQAPHRQQQHADDQGVGYHHPLDGFQGGVKVGFHIGQGDEDAAVVHHGKEGAGGDGPENPPFVGSAGDDALYQGRNRLGRRGRPASSPGVMPGGGQGLVCAGGCHHTPFGGGGGMGGVLAAVALRQPTPVDAPRCHAI